MGRDERVREILEKYIPESRYGLDPIGKCLAAIKQEYAQEEAYQKALEKILTLPRSESNWATIINIAEQALCGKARVCQCDNSHSAGITVQVKDGKRYCPKCGGEVKVEGCSQCALWRTEWEQISEVARKLKVELDKLTAEPKKECQECKGTGVTDLHETEMYHSTCPKCNGTGQVNKPSEAEPKCKHKTKKDHHGYWGVRREDWCNKHNQFLAGGTCDSCKSESEVESE